MMTDSSSDLEISSKLNPCNTCGGKRTFELQLMPALVSILHSSQTNTNSGRSNTLNAERNVLTDSSDIDVNSTGDKNFVDSTSCTIEFGTVLVYTCAASCWTEGQKYVDESVIVIPDPDTELLKSLF